MDKKEEKNEIKFEENKPAYIPNSEIGEGLETFKYGKYITHSVYGTTAQTAITYGSEYVFNAGTSNYISVATLDSTHFVVGYRDAGNSYYGTAIIGTISPDFIPQIIML